MGTGTTSIPLFLVVVLTVTGVIHAFLYRRLVVGLGIRAHRWRWTLRGLAFYLAVSYPLTRWLESWAPEGVVVVTHWIAVLWVGFMLHALWVGLALWIVKALLQITGIWKRWRVRHARIGRFAVAGTVAVALVLCIVGYGGARQAATVRHVDVPVKGFTPALGRLKIAVFADLHAGLLVDGTQVRRRVDEVLALRPDLILVPGDILDYPPERLPNALRELARLRAPLGVFATTGNHEYYVGFEEGLAFLRSAGMRVLLNETVELPVGLVLAGIEDRTADTMGRLRPTPAAILGGVAKTKPTIFLDHTPATREVEAVVAAGADLCVSGHTHGGQVWPFSLLTKLAFPNHRGTYAVGAGTQLTTCGLGWWGPPMRLGTTPEICVVSLVARPE